LSGSPVAVENDDVLSSLAETLQLLQRAIGYSEGMAMAMDPDVLLPTQFATTFPVDHELALLACRNEQQDTDVFKFRDLAEAVCPVATLSADHDPECQTSMRWQKLLLPRGRRHELRAAVVDSEGWCWGALALYRRERIRFSRSDLEVVRRVLPGRAANLARSMVVSRAPGSPEVPTSLLVDETGAVIDGTDSSIRWLDEIGRSDKLDRVGMLLTSLAARIRHMHEDEVVRRPVRVRMRSAGGAWTTLIAESLRGEQDRRWIPVVVMATDSAQLFPLQVAAFGLSDREAEVVDQVVKGLDTKSIAQWLSISVLTVQDHLKSVFDKTGVHSRGELTYLLGRASGQ
jgi:DNA-binding CsgD family transcriptional regulator